MGFLWKVLIFLSFYDDELKIFRIFANNLKPIIKMALFKVTTRARKLTNGILIEPGMSVEVATVSAVNPITANGGQAVADAFMRVYGIDLKKAGALNSAYLEAIKIR